MENLNRCIIGIGSNREKESNLQNASEILSGWFINISFSAPLLSPAISPEQNTESYLNQTAIAFTDKSLEETICFLKETEIKLGRKKSDKLAGSIPIDLDLVKWNDTLLKEVEWNQPYFQSGLTSLLEKEKNNSENF